ncbi:MAG: hypothetical protein M3246_07740, partial [Actinomycetota bacterium]|nr:hypothetical protein [Actinomycetota bacterium]
MILLVLTMLAVSVLSACADLGYDGDDRPGFVAEASYLGPLSLVGALKGDPNEFDQGVFGDVAAYKNLAFLGKGRRECPATGVDIIDISQPSTPTKLSDTNDYPDTSMEDMQAIEIDGRDILVIGLQDCQNDPV